jgi:hypothetical protein
MKISIKIKNNKAHPPMAPTMSGKKDWLLVSFLLLVFETGLSVVDVTIDSEMSHKLI